MIPFLLGVAFGAPDPTSLRPVLVSPDTPDRFATWRAIEALPPDTLACELVWAQTNLLCFRIWEGDRRRFVLTSDLRTWQLAIGDVHAMVARRAAERLRGAELVPVVGMEASYLRLVDSDGWAAAGLFRPDLLAERLGGLPIRVAVPTEDVLVAWRGQGDELDRVVAVGVREMYDRGAATVSPRVWQWDGQVWMPFGEAVPATPGSGPR